MNLNLKSGILTILTLICLTVVSSCKKDDDNDPITPPDPCANVTCLNGGTCLNGTCSCPDGYTGSACEDQVTPTKIRITKIVVTKFPATSGSGAGWDLTSGPDIFPEIKKGSTIIWSSSTFSQNANPSLDYEFIPAPQIDINYPNDQYTISLFDYDDLDPNDFMGGIYFTPYSSSNDFPSTLIIDGGGDVAFTIYVTYIW